jgi:hypothetical protein
MREAVIAMDGLAYERAALEAYITGCAEGTLSAVFGINRSC